MIKKLRRNFVLINMTIVTILLSAILGLVFRFNYQVLKNENVEQIHRLSMEAMSHQPIEHKEQRFPRDYFIIRQESDGSLTAWGSDYYEQADSSYLEELLSQVRAAGKENGTLQEHSLRYRWDEARGYCVFLDISDELRILKNLSTSCILAGLGSFVVFFGVSILLARMAVKPIERAWEQQRQFVADASHELKTPLAVIMANAELLESGEQNLQERRRFVSHILTASYHMRSLVEHLLELAKLDNVNLSLEPLELSQLTEDAVLSVQLLFEEKCRPLKWNIEEGVCIRGSENHLYQLLDVLLDNALKYSEGEGTVEVILKNQGRSCSLSVTSPGTPLTRQESQDIFKRFYRGDRARTMDGSYGLGLAIAQNIVTAHWGRIRVTTGTNSNTFTVQFPTSQPPGGG